MTSPALKNNFLPPGLVSNLQQALANRKPCEDDAVSSKADDDSARPFSSEGEDNSLKPVSDGIESPGLSFLVDALVAEAAYNVNVIAPQSDKTTSAHSVSLKETIEVASVEVKGTTAYEISGTPVDCVSLALSGALFSWTKPLLVISGINKGSSCGHHMFYSSVVAGATEALVYGVPSISISLNWQDESQESDFKDAVAVCLPIIKAAMRDIEKGVFPKGFSLDLELPRSPSTNKVKKEGFYHVIGESSPQGVNMHRRAVVRKNTSRNKVFGDLRSISRARSIICEHGKLPWIWNLRMLRTLHAYKFTTDEYRVNYMSRNVNMRHLAVKVVSASSIFSSYRHLWNLRTLIIVCLDESIVPFEIWKMPQLRHIKIWKRHLLANPSSDGVVTENLVVLKGAHNFKCDEEVVKRIPNIKKLGIRYSGSKGIGHDDYYCLSNTKCLSKLELLDVSCEYDFRGNASLYKLTFPQTLMSLTLEMEDDFEWEMMLEKIGSLPLLEKLKLHGGCFRTGKWEIFEGQFPCLKYLGMFSCRSLKSWTAEEESSIIFPRLENLHHSHLEGLENIPSEIGFIPTLQKLWIVYCSESAVICAKEIVD